METRALLSGIALVTSGIGAIAMVLGVLQVVANRSRVSAARRTTSGSQASMRFFREGIPTLYPFARRLLMVAYARQICGRFARALEEKGLATNTLSLASMVCLALLIVIPLCILQRSATPAALFAVVAVVLCAWASAAEDRYHDRIRNDLPDALRAMGACFHAGFTLPQTFKQLQKETTGPLQRVFMRASQSMDTGRTAHEVLGDMRHDAGIPELSFVAVALEVQHESGGSMQHVLDATGDMLKSELELRRSLKVQTAQARLSARVVVAVTIGLVAILMGLTEDFLNPFFSSVTGLVLLATAIGMQVLGIVLVRRMLNVSGA